MLFLIACGGGNSSEQPSRISLPVIPAISIDASVTNTTTNSEFSITWSVNHADSCQALDDWSGDKTTSGSETILESDAGTKVYTLTCSGPGGDSSADATVVITNDVTGVWDYTEVSYGTEDPLRQWLNIHLAYDQSLPSPVYLFAHANGGTAYSMSEKQLNTIASEGYTTISWESIPTINTSTDLTIAVADAQMVFDWVRDNAEVYNLNPDHIVIASLSDISTVVQVQRTTDQIVLHDQEEIAVVGLTLESDFYRNYAYDCGLSGNYTFMVVNPAGGGLPHTCTSAL